MNMMPPSVPMAPSRKITPKNHDKKVLSPVLSKFKLLPSIQASETVKQKPRPKLLRSKSQEVISKSKKQMLVRGGETVPTLSPIRFSHGNSSSTSKLTHPYVPSVLPMQPRRYSFGVSKSLPPSGGNGSRRGSDDFNNNTRYSRPANQNHATVVLPQLLVKPSLESNDLKGNFRNHNPVFSSGNLEANHRSMKKSKSTSSFDLETQQKKSVGNKSKPKRSNVGHSLLSAGGMSDFGHPVMKTKFSKSTECLPSVGQSFNKPTQNSFMSNISEQENLEWATATSAAADGAEKHSAAFTSPWADEATDEFQSTFTTLPIPAYKSRSVSLQNSPRMMFNNAQVDGKHVKNPHWQLKTTGTTCGEKSPNPAMTRNSVHGKPEISLQEPQANGGMSSSSESNAPPMMERNPSTNLEHKRSFNCKKSKPKLMRNRTFDVIETKMQNLPVIDLEADDD